MEPDPRMHCYAETFAETFRGVPGHPFEQGFDLRLVPDKLEEPLRWRRPKRIFVNSMSRGEGKGAVTVSRRSVNITGPPGGATEAP